MDFYILLSYPIILLNLFISSCGRRIDALDFLFKQSSSANRDGFISFLILMPLQTRQLPCPFNVLDITVRQEK